MRDLLFRPWPWYVAGPLLGLFAPLLLWLGNRLFGVSSNLRHLCAAILPRGTPYTSYDWRRAGGWNLAFAAGIIIGGVLAGVVFRNPEPVAISAATHDTLASLGVHDFTGLVPRELFSWSSLATVRGLIAIVGGGFLVGFGTAYAGGCTSGHGISGVANLEIPSFIALAGFFAGGLLGTFLLVPLALGALR
ncbi:MAG TPA: YeeE/YedE thiosulfate transporter family protein [Gemmatimonadaceae bacterium]|nr:YeeE/YedE thiosulfate transporter family protein [Gemmatimonadaceae bacterium]